MALVQSDRANRLTQQQNIKANVIMEIEDDAFPEIFGLVGVNRSLRIGDFEIGDEYKIGGVIVNENSRDWLQERGTTNNITQKVDTDKPGASSSITTFKINLVDKNEKLTEMFSPGVRAPDVLGLKATVYWAPLEGAHPEDSTPIFRGIISTIEFGAGSVSLIIDSPEQLKRQDLLSKYNSVLTSAIDSSVTTIPVESTANFITSQDSLTSYVRIDDEVIEVGDISGNDFINCTRGSLGTIATTHDLDVELESFYRITEDSPIDITLKMIISGTGVFGNSSASRINQVNDSTFIQNGLLVKNDLFKDDTGLVTGDTCTITGATNAANNVVDRDIIDFQNVPEGTVIVLSGSDMVTEGGDFSINFKSKYDTLNFGCAIEPFHVDIERFEEIKDLVGTQQPTFDAYVKDTINARDYIDSEILFPSGLFGLFRKGRISVGANLPPLSSQNTKYLNAETVKNPEAIKVKRSFKRAFYNATVFKFEENVLDDRFLAGRIVQSSDSTNRIKVGNKPLTIEARGVRDTPVNRNRLDVISRRTLDRYQYGAEMLTVETNFKTGFTVEVGDSVVLEGSTLNISDSKTGSRDYVPRVLECVNKSMSLKTGRIKLDVIDSVFEVDARYGVISPASFLDSGSTVSELKLKTSFATVDGVPESRKWEDYVGQRIQVRSADFAFQEIVTIVSISDSDPNVLEIQPDLSAAPPQGYLIEPPPYEDGDIRTDSFYKSQHVYPSKQVDIASGISSTQFTVSDTSNLILDTKILVHSADYSDEAEVLITDITGTTVTVEDLGFTPDNTYGLIPIRFLDNGYTYRAF